MSEHVLKAFHAMRLRPDDQWMRDNPEACATVEANILHGASFALPSADNPAVLCGVVVRHGIGTVWMIVGEGFAKHWRDVLLSLRPLCHSAVRVFKLRRLQMLVDASQPAHCRFAKAIGFLQESVVPHVGLGPRGEDILIFIWRKGS